jgi:hypothetical protein
MPIKPVDFQIMIPRTMDASKSQNDEFSKLMNLQQVAKENLQHDSERGVRQVQHREKAYKSDIQKDGKGRGGQEQNAKKDGKQNRNESGTDDAKALDQNSIHHIDIKI